MTVTIPVILSSDDIYAPYLGVTVKSVIENAAPDNKYEIFILDGGISVLNQKQIQSLSEPNVQIRFIRPETYMQGIDLSVFYVRSHFSLPTYYRLFIPEIFRKYDRVLYLDCDMIVLDDVAKLFGLDMQGKMLAAVKDVGIQKKLLFNDKNFIHYLKDVLKLRTPSDYLQAGVIVFDIKRLRQFDFMNKCLETLKEIKTPLYVDQDIINSVSEGNVHFIGQEWNFQRQAVTDVFNEKEISQSLPPDIFEEFTEALAHPKIIHYAGEEKPWKYPRHPLFEQWWHYARMTPFYEGIIYDNTMKNFVAAEKLREIFNYKKLSLKYLYFNFLGFFTFGKKRKKYKQKRKELKAHLKQVRAFLRGK